MIKNVFVFLVLALFIAVSVWLFVQKNEDANNGVKATLESKDVPDKEETAFQEVVLENGLKYEDLKIGEGETVRSGDLLSVHYIGMLQDGTKFDSSYDRNKAFLFKLGDEKLVPGWNLGIAGMQVGGKRKITIPPDLGYGERGAGGSIPPNATLIFEVELLDARTVQ